MNSGRLVWSFAPEYDVSRIAHFNLYQRLEGAPTWSVIQGGVLSSVREFAMADIDDGLRHFRIETVQKAQREGAPMLMSDVETSFLFVTNPPAEPDWPAPPPPTFAWVPDSA